MSIQDIGIKLSANYHNGVKEGLRVAIDVLREKFNGMKWETGGGVERFEPCADIGSSSIGTRTYPKEEPYKAWLIERSSAAEYFEHARCGVALWTNDPSEALQFSTSQDAYNALLVFDEELEFSRRGTEVFRVEEHAFNG